MRKLRLIASGRLPKSLVCGRCRHRSLAERELEGSATEGPNYQRLADSSQSLRMVELTASRNGHHQAASGCGGATHGHHGGGLPRRLPQPLLSECLQPKAFAANAATYRSSDCLDGGNGPMVAASTALGAWAECPENSRRGDSQDCCWMAGADHLSSGIVALSFVDFGDKAESNAGRAANARRRLHPHPPGSSDDDSGGSFRLSYDQLKQQLAGLQDQLKDAEALQERFQKGVDDNTDVPFGPSLDEAKEKAESLRLAIQKTQRELDGARFASDKAGASYLDNLQKQSVVAGKLTEVEKLRAQINAGILKLSPDDEKRALAYAAAVDKANASTKSQKDLLKDSAKGLKQAEERYRDLKKEIDPPRLRRTSTGKHRGPQHPEGQGKITSQEYAKGIEWAAKSFNSAVDAANPFVKRLREIKSAMDESLGNLKLEGQREILGMGMSDSQRGCSTS